MYSLCVNALFRFSIKSSALVTIKFPLEPCCHGRVEQKMSYKFLLQARITIYGIYAYIHHELELLCIALGCDCYMMNAI